MLTGQFAVSNNSRYTISRTIGVSICQFNQILKVYASLTIVIGWTYICIRHSFDGSYYFLASFTTTTSRFELFLGISIINTRTCELFMDGWIGFKNSRLVDTHNEFMADYTQWNPINSKVNSVAQKLYCFLSIRMHLYTTVCSIT